MATESVQAQAPVPRLAGLPSSAEQRVALPRSTSPRTAQAEYLGHLSGETELTRMSLVLQPSAEQDAALTQLLADQQNPASQSYHRWLTPEQFGARFGASSTDLSILQTWLQTQGFTVASVAGSRNSIIFAGTAYAAEQAFGVTLQRYRRDGREFFENSGSIHLPAPLAAVVGGVSGLSSYRLPAPRIKREAARADALARPQYTTSTGTHYLVPWDFRQIYAANTLINSGYDGTGIKIGVIGQSAVDTAQVTYFQEKTGQPVKLPTMVLVPYTSAPAKVAGDEAESELDLEYTGGTAPGAPVQFIYTGCADASTGNCNNNGVFDALGYAITNNLAPILSVSYGGCETDDASYALSTLEPLLKQANAQGQTIVVSSGDSGAASCEQSVTATRASAGLSVSYPASSPYVTAVGGTQLNTDSPAYWNSSNNTGSLGSASGYMPETAWNDTASYGSLAASGGGVSKIFSKPPWQFGTGVPGDGQRDVPDIAFAANVSEHAYLICDADDPCLTGSGGFVIGRDGGAVGGTSASAPNFAAVLAIIEQANGGPALGNINPSLYALAEGTSRADIFHDITTGNNMVPCVTGSQDCANGSLGYNAAPGYDLVTGLGSVSAAALQPALAAYAASTASVGLTVSSVTPAVGSPVIFTAAVSASTSTPSGTVTFSVDGTVTSPAVEISSGTVAYSYSGFTTSGRHTVTAAYSGDSTYAAGSASVTVNALLSAPVISVLATPAAPVTGSAVVLTASVSGPSGAPTGTVSFFVDMNSTAAGIVTLSNGIAAFSYSGFNTAGVHAITATYNGDATYQSSSASSSVTVASPAHSVTPTVQLTVTPNAIFIGTPIAIAVAVTVTGTGSTPTGTVSYTIDGVPASTGTLISAKTSLTYPGFSAAGTHSVLATYSGDGTYVPASASSTIMIAAPGIGLSFNTSTLSMASGGNGSLTATVASQNGFAGPVGFKLSMVSSTGATFAGCYSLSPTTVTPLAGGSAFTTLTMSTASSSCTANGGTTLSRATHGGPDGSGKPFQPPSRSGATIVAAGLLGCFLLRRSIRGRVLLLAMIAASALSLSGCGSGISSNSAATVTTPATPTAPSTEGTYVIQVSATSASDTSVTSTAQFTLKVQ